MLLTKEVKVKLWTTNTKHYLGLGYKGKFGDVITVKVGDLTSGSDVKVDVLCDYCGIEVLHIPYYEYKKRMDKNGTCACNVCKFIKAKETNREKYGCDNPAQNEKVKAKVRETNLERYGAEYSIQTKEVRERAKQTCIERYGVDNISKLKEFQEKKKATNLEKYGFPCSFQNEEVKAKCRENNMKKYGVEYVTQLREMKEKSKQTCLERYGVTNSSQNKNIKQKQINTLFEHFGVSNPMYSDVIKEKLAQSLYESNGVRTSKQQRYLHKLYGGELNYPISYFSADICLPDEKIVIEYNGGGHNLQVKTGKMTQEEYEQREIVRENVIKRQGYKTITIISSKDLLPSDTILLQMLNESRTYFNSTPHTWCTFDIDNSTIRNAEHKTGTLYDFGELRQIKEAS